MQHPRHAEVLHVDVGARHLRGNVEPRHRGADHRVGGARLGLEVAGDGPAEAPAAHELAVGGPPRRIVDHAHHAVRGGELIHRGGQPHRGEEPQGIPRVGGGLPDDGGAALNGLAPGGDALIGRARGITLHHRDAPHRHIQLLGDDLGQRGGDAGAELHLPGVEGDAAVGRDGEPRVDLAGWDGLAGRRDLAGQHRLVLADARRLGAAGGRERERDDQGSRRLQQRATGQASAQLGSLHLSARLASGCGSPINRGPR
jgi:hypothetical protein